MGKSVYKLGTGGHRLMIASHHLSGAEEPACECSKAGMMFACSVNVSLQIAGHFVKDIL